MARLFNGTSDVLYGDVPTSLALPFSFAAWFRSTQNTDGSTIMALTDKDATNKTWRLQGAGNVSGDPVRLFCNDGSASQGVNTTTGWTINTWHHACAVIAATDSRFVYLDAGGKTEGTTEVDPLSAIDRVAIGDRGNSEHEYFLWSEAEAAIFNIALSDEQVAILAAGASPLVFRSNLLWYSRIDGDDDPEPDEIGGLDLTVTGTTKSDHPAITYPGLMVGSGFLRR